MLIHHPVLRLWDSLQAAVVFRVRRHPHRTPGIREPRHLLLLLASMVVSLLAMEAAARMLLPRPPMSPIPASSIHWLLKSSMRSNSALVGWDYRSKEIVCSIAYGPRYQSMVSPEAINEVLTPERFIPKPGVTRRVVHVGDSMVFGFGVQRNETIPAQLEKLEPETQQIDGGVPGTAPDAYLAVLRRWVDTTHIDLALMYFYEGNDLEGVDAPFPCCDWKSLLNEEAAGAPLRCPTSTAADVDRAGFDWLRNNSPAPVPRARARGSIRRRPLPRREPHPFAVAPPTHSTAARTGHDPPRSDLSRRPR